MLCIKQQGIVLTNFRMVIQSISPSVPVINLDREHMHTGVGEYTDVFLRV